MSDPDGLALLLLFALGGVAFLALALAIEAYLARGMRLRRRQREALRRYLASIGPDAWPGRRS